MVQVVVLITSVPPGGELLCCLCLYLKHLKSEIGNKQTNLSDAGWVLFF